jgi:hypothetical protein
LARPHWIGLSRTIDWRCWRTGLAAQADCESIDSRYVLAILAFDHRANSTIRILVCFCRCFFDRLNFLLPGCDIGRDGILGINDVGRGVVAPSDGIPKLLLVRLQRLGRPVDCSARGLRCVTRPHVGAVENGGLLALPRI